MSIDELYEELDAGIKDLEVDYGQEVTDDMGSRPGHIHRGDGRLTCNSPTVPTQHLTEGVLQCNSPKEIGSS